MQSSRHAREWPVLALSLVVVAIAGVSLCTYVLVAVADWIWS